MRTMPRDAVRLLPALTALVTQFAYSASWTPPIGIPAPPFGIKETAPASPSPWNAASTTRAGYQFYFVCSTCKTATDTKNPHGYPARPRLTIPNPIPAGSVVQVEGLYSQRHTSPRTLLSQGTAAHPVFVRGANAAARPNATQPWEIKGTYTIIENFEFSGDGLAVLAPGNHMALRHSDLHGTLKSGGLAIVSWSNESLDHVVIYNNKIHDNGDVKAKYDQDVHGIGVGSRVSYVWVIDNEMARNSGDGIQINAGTAALQSTTHHLYVGRNVSHHNKQTGFWTKQAVDVIFSENTSYGHRTSDSSSGDGMGGQYAPAFVWYLFNRIYDNESGIRIASDSSMGTGSDIFIIGNLIYNIHKVTSAYNVNSVYEASAIASWGGSNTYVLNNTLWDIDAGIHVPRQHGKIDLFNNIIAAPSVKGASQIYLESASVASASAMDYNLLQNTSAIRWGEGSNMTRSLASFQSAFRKGPHCQASGAEHYKNAAGADFRLLPTSPAVDAGARIEQLGTDVYALFEKRYGLDIRKDLRGTPRPQGGGFDIGAIELSAGEKP